MLVNASPLVSNSEMQHVQLLRLLLALLCMIANYCSDLRYMFKRELHDM